MNQSKKTPDHKEVTTIKTPEEYIALQPEDRQRALVNLRQVIQQHLPSGFAEVIQYGMIGFVVPHAIYPSGYHVTPKEPLPFLALANQKNYIALYHMGLYMDQKVLDWFVESYQALNIGKLDMGKSCIRFKKLETIPYELLGLLCSKMTVESYIDLYESSKAHTL